MATQKDRSSHVHFAADFKKKGKNMFRSLFSAPPVLHWLAIFCVILCSLSEMRVFAQSALSQPGNASKQVDDDTTDKVKHYQNLLFNLDPTLRKTAAQELAKLAPLAAPALPRLIEIVAGPEEPSTPHASEAIVRIGPAAMAPLVNAYKKVKNDDKASRGRLLVVLGRLYDGDNAEVGQVLSEAMKDPSESVRHSALAWAWWNERPFKLKEALPILLAQLSNEPDSIGWRECVALSRFGEGARDALPKLDTIARNRKNDNQLRQQSLTAMVHVAPKDKKVVEYVVAVMNDESEERSIRGLAVALLMRRLPDAAKVRQETLLAFIKNREKKNVTMRSAALYGMRFLRLKDAVGVLQKIVDDKTEHPQARIGAIEALAQQGPDARIAVPSVLKAISEQNLAEWVASDSPQLLEEMIGRESALAELRRLIDASPDPDTRKNYVRMSIAIENSERPILPP